MGGYMENVDERDPRQKTAGPKDVPLEEDLTGGGLLAPGILGVDVAEIHPEAGTPASLDIVGDDGSTGWGGAEPTLPPG
jgi:hypothetical protein